MGNTSCLTPGRLESQCAHGPPLPAGHRGGPSLKPLTLFATLIGALGVGSLVGGGYILLNAERFADGWTLMNRLREPGTPALDVAGLQAQSIVVASVLVIVGILFLAGAAAMVVRQDRSNQNQRTGTA